MRLKGILLIVLAVYMFILTGRDYWAHKYYPLEFSSLWQNELVKQPIKALRKAIRISSDNADYYHKLAKVRLDMLINNTDKADSALYQEVVDNSEIAINKNPLSGEYYITLGQAYALITPEAFNRQAAGAFDKAVDLNPTDIYSLYSAGYYRLYNWNYLNNKEKFQTINQLKKLISIDERYFSEILLDCWQITGDYRLTCRIIPPKAFRRREFAKLLADSGRLKEYALEMAKAEYLMLNSMQELRQKDKGYYEYAAQKYPEELGSSMFRLVPKPKELNIGKPVILKPEAEESPPATASRFFTEFILEQSEGLRFIHNDGCTNKQYEALNLTTLRVRDDTEYRDSDSLTIRYINKAQWRGKSGKNVYKNGAMYWSGSISAPIVLEQGKHSLYIRAKAAPAGGIWPLMEVRLGDDIVYMTYVDKNNWQEYSFYVFRSEAGAAKLTVSFVNDGGDVKTGEDRNLFIGDVRIR